MWRLLWPSQPKCFNVDETHKLKRAVIYSRYWEREKKVGKVTETHKGAICSASLSTRCPIGLGWHLLWRSCKCVSRHSCPPAGFSEECALQNIIPHKICTSKTHNKFWSMNFFQWDALTLQKYQLIDSKELSAVYRFKQIQQLQNSAFRLGTPPLGQVNTLNLWRVLISFRIFSSTETIARESSRESRECYCEHSESIWGVLPTSLDTPSRKWDHLSKRSVIVLFILLLSTRMHLVCIPVTPT